jgi:hypothetical protein
MEQQMTYEDLKLKAEEERRNLLKKLSENYALARSLGLTPAESQIAKTKSVEEIRRLAEEKTKHNGG